MNNVGTDAAFAAWIQHGSQWQMVAEADTPSQAMTEAYRWASEQGFAPANVLVLPEGVRPDEPREAHAVTGW